MTIPKLSFIYAYPLDRGRRVFFEEKGLKYPSMDEVNDSIKHYENVWAEQEKKYNIIETLIELTGRTPERNFECFVFGSGLQVMSTPFLLPIWNKEGKPWTDEKFIDLTIHELLHIFLVTDSERYWNEVKIRYVDEEPVCRNHIILYAMLYEVYQSLFAKEPLDFTRDNLPLGYARAVQLVKEIGYKKLIAEYKSLT
jgi:hypothetical protein